MRVVSTLAIHRLIKYELVLPSVARQLIHAETPVAALALSFFAQLAARGKPWLACHRSATHCARREQLHATRAAHLQRAALLARSRGHHSHFTAVLSRDASECTHRDILYVGTDEVGTAN
jgi:hypothetical protein